MGSRSRVGTNRNERRRSEPVKWYTRRGAEAVEGAWQCAPAAAAGFVVRMCARAERRENGGEAEGWGAPRARAGSGGRGASSLPSARVARERAPFSPLDTRARARSPAPRHRCGAVARANAH